ncbi:unnamed protein product [Auanema sp. JU1783]|nr:unnamed protein product [Auanema sp. JU1783]
MWLYPLLLTTFCSFSCTSSSWENLNLPTRLLEYHIRSNIDLKERCLIDSNCPIKSDLLTSSRCWGYEEDCHLNDTYAHEVELGKCNLHTDRPIVRDAPQVFFDQGDFGYLKSRLIKNEICISNNSLMSSLSCSDSLLYCYARNIFFDLSSFQVAGSARYRNDLIHEGEIGGNCEIFNSEVLNRNLDAKSYLQSWAHELKHFSSSNSFSVSQENCDIIFERPTVLMKLDASINMYHHFCDFVNLYASLHINNSFAQQIDVVWWDTHSEGFIDKFFGITWEAFSVKKPTELINLAGKRVCFRDVMLPLLARQRFGLFYNMPLTPGCSGSGLIHSFSHFILHRLQVEQTDKF